MRKFLILPTALCSAVIATAILLVQTPQRVEAYADTPAVSCRAANLAFAQELRWDHIRVWNPSSTPIWVVCPVTNNTELWWSSADSTNHGYGPSQGTLSAWFDSSAIASQVQCTWLDLDPTITGTSVTNWVTHTITAPATLPGVQSQTFDLSLFNGFYSGTVTCRLDPNTGINSYVTVVNRQLF